MAGVWVLMDMEVDLRQEHTWCLLVGTRKWFVLSTMLFLAICVPGRSQSFFGLKRQFKEFFSGQAGVRGFSVFYMGLLEVILSPEMTQRCLAAWVVGSLKRSNIQPFPRSREGLLTGGSEIKWR
jgi:hypothetical protein